MIIYNQMTDITEAVLRRLSLLTQMTKHISVKASGEKSSQSELGAVSPIFVWLIRDVLEEYSPPREYMEFILKTSLFKSQAHMNEIRESFQTLFPYWECFILEPPLTGVNKQEVDQMPIDKLKPEFQSGLNDFTKYVFDRARPKQVGLTMMTGTVLVGIIESYLGSINNGAMHSISSSWQSVGEAECRKAYDSATAVYKSSFDRSKPPEEDALREAYGQAVQKSMAVFYASAVGVGSARKKYEDLLQEFFIKDFEDSKNAYMEADLQCSKTIQSIEKRLITACNAPDAKIDNVSKDLDTLLSEYGKSVHGPNKLQHLTVLQKCVLDLRKKLLQEVESDKSSLALQDNLSSELAALKSQSDAAVTRLAAEKEQAQSAHQEAGERKRKYGSAFMDSKVDLEKAASSPEHTKKKAQLRGDASREEFSGTLAEKVEEIKEKTAKIEPAERCSTTLKLELEAAESKIRSYETQIFSLTTKNKELTDKIRSYESQLC